MPTFENEGVIIYYEIEGSGPELVLIHGFGSNMEDNWKNSNWVNYLKDSN